MEKGKTKYQNVIENKESMSDVRRASFLCAAVYNRVSYCNSFLLFYTFTVNFLFFYTI